MAIQAKVKVCEMFQTIERDVEVETYEELSDEIRKLREAIKEGCSDILDKKKPAEKQLPKPVKKNENLATESQIKWIKKKASASQLASIDFDTLTQEEASAILDDLF